MTTPASYTLSPSLRKIGWRRYLAFSGVNGFSFGLLAENVLVLYALKAGVPEHISGILVSFMFLGLPLMLVGKRMMRHIGAARTQATAWGARNLCALIMACAPFFAVFGGQTLVVWTIVVCAFGFYACRAIGIIAFRPLMGEITTDADYGRFMGAMGIRFNGSYFVALMIFVMVMKFSPTLHMFQALIGLGCVTGMAAAVIVARIPETPGPRESAAQPILGSIVKLWHNRTQRKLIFAQMAGWGGFAMTVPISMVALKAGYGVSEFHAVLFILIQVAGSTLMAFMLGVVADKTGPRPLLILYGAGFFFICILWTLTPVQFFPFYTVLIFILGGAGKSGINLGLNHYFLRTTKEHERVMANLVVQILGGASAGVAGCLISGSLIKLLNDAGLESLQVYRIYFAVIAALLLPLIWMIYRLDPVRDWEVKNVLGLIISPRDLYALHRLLKLDKTQSVSEDRYAVDKLANIGSNLSETTLIEVLMAPDFTIRDRALRALRAIELSPRGEKALIKEVQKHAYTTAYIAAEILGEQKACAAIPVLRKSLHSNDIYLQGKSMVALVRLGDTDAYAHIKEIFNNTTNPRLAIHGALALLEMNDSGNLSLLLTQAVCADLPAAVKHEIFQRAAELTGHGDAFYQFHKLYRSDTAAAISDITEQVSEEYKDLLTDFDRGNISIAEGLRQLCALTERDVAANNISISLCTFIRECDASGFDAELFVGLVLLCGKL